MNKLKSVKTKQGNEICLFGNAPHGKTLVIGVFHGDEPQGKYLIEEYIKKIEKENLSAEQCNYCLSSTNHSPLAHCQNHFDEWNSSNHPPFAQGQNHFDEGNSSNHPPIGHCRNHFDEENSANHPPLAGGSKSLISGRGIACHNYSVNAKLNAKILRINMQKPERILWKYLCNKQLLNKKFRRQQPIGGYVVDFMCCNPKIIIELDGSQHNEKNNIHYDIKRDIYLKEQGFKIIRIWNNEIYNNIEGVIEFIKNEILNPSPKSEISTLPQGEGSLRNSPNENDFDTTQGEGSLRNSPNQYDFNSAQGVDRPQFSIHNENCKSSQETSCQMLSQRNNLLFIPCLNPDGMQAGTRTNSNGVDLNRNFPTNNWVLSEKNEFFGGYEPASEIETQFLIDTIEEFKPDTILTLHAPYKVVNYDGPAKELAQKISEIMKYPVEESIGYPTPGSFGTYAGIERKIKTITLELDEVCPVEELTSPVHRVLDIL